MTAARTKLALIGEHLEQIRRRGARESQHRRERGEKSRQQRDGEDLHCELTIPFTTAALGGELEVPTLSGKGEITIPEGTQTGKTFRLRGKGIRGVRSSYPGDLYCHVSVETPVRLTDEQKKILRQFETSLSQGGEKHSPKSESWTDRVKSFFS